MNKQPQPELISFKICPFVQRAAIILNEKKIDFTTTYIDLKNPPDWFGKLSPLGKVPILKIADAIVFESAVIAEYLDEAYPPQLHPKDLLLKAQHRSWTEFASDMTVNLFTMIHAKNQQEMQQPQQKLAEQLQKVARQIDATGPFFAGEQLSLVDAAYAPLFLRLHIMEKHYPLNILTQNSRISTWAEALLQKPSVKNSVVSNFEDLFIDYIKDSNSYLGHINNHKIY